MCSIHWQADIDVLLHILKKRCAWSISHTLYDIPQHLIVKESSEHLHHAFILNQTLYMTASFIKMKKYLDVLQFIQRWDYEKVIVNITLLPFGTLLSHFWLTTISANKWLLYNVILYLSDIFDKINLLNKQFQEEKLWSHILQRNYSYLGKIQFYKMNIVHHALL